MFETLSRSWRFAKLSYGMLWNHKRLLVFPLISGIAALLVLISFAIPLWASGALEAWAGEDGESVGMWATLLAFYFALYFVIVFFNSALIACAMKALEGERPTLGYGLRMAAGRLHLIIVWALISAVVGVLLRSIERNAKAGAFISAILGTAWTALTYFVIPVLVMEQAGAVASVKRSAGILRQTWGTALVSHFSLGLVGFLLALPVILIGGILLWLAISAQQIGLVIAVIVAVAVAMIILSLASSAADTILKALLYQYATGRALPADVPAGEFGAAFAPKRSGR